MSQPLNTGALGIAQAQLFHVLRERLLVPGDEADILVWVMTVRERAVLIARMRRALPKQADRLNVFISLTPGILFA